MNKDNLDQVVYNVEQHDNEVDGKILDLREEFGKLLLPFHFTSVTTLLDIMMLSESVISGIAALALVHPGVFTPDRLDFVVPSKRAAWLLLHLQDHGYKISPTFDTQHDDYDRNNSVVLTFAHPVSDKSINVVMLMGSHFVHHVTQFYSTLLMNYIAWYGLVSLYPQWTTEKKGLIVKNSAMTRLTFQKYCDMGFSLSTDNGALVELPNMHVCKAGYDCPRTMRSLLDEECAFHPFEDVEHDLGNYEAVVMWKLATACKFSGRV